MFVNIVEFPNIKKGRDKEFIAWFRWSNRVYSQFEGFISRRLLKSTKGKRRYVATVEHKNEKTFMTMHLSKQRQNAWLRVDPLFKGSPKPRFYKTVVASKIRQ